MESMDRREAFVAFVRTLQDEICAAVSQEDGRAFREDAWERPGGGGGRTRVLEDGPVIEKGGVNSSTVHGPTTERLKRHMKTTAEWFFATGISLVLHPRNPHAPTVHANFRYFELRAEEGGPLMDAWFGGGADLTPYYLYENDAQHFHTVLHAAVAEHAPQLYAKFKQWCDEYFWNTHRDEARGVGGLFFDWLRAEDGFTLDDRMAFTQAVGRAFLPAYLPILQRRKATTHTDAERYWQEIRRGRYVEFNLIHDRGTKFGLESDGRTESILMSLPPRCRWNYDHQPEPGSREAELIAVLKQPKDWLA